MKLIDLSQPLYNGAPNCPAHPAVKSEIIATHEKVGWRVEYLMLASHTGSHVDAPLHKLAGAPSLDDIPLESWVGQAYIADLRGIAPDALIGAQLLAEKLPGDLHDRIILLATGWGQKRAKTEEWLHHSPPLVPDGAQWLVDHGIRGALGLRRSSMSIGRFPDRSLRQDVDKVSYGFGVGVPNVPPRFGMRCWLDLRLSIRICFRDHNYR